MSNEQGTYSLDAGVTVPELLPVQSVISRSGRWESGPATAGGCARGRGPQALKTIWRQELAVLTSARPQVPQHPWGGSLPGLPPCFPPLPKAVFLGQEGTYKCDVDPRNIVTGQNA